MPEIGQTCDVAVAGEREGWQPGALRWRPDDADVALVAAPEIGSDLSPVRWGRLTGVQPWRWDAAGYPFASMDRRGRHLEHAWGTVSPLTLSDVGEFGLTVESRAPQFRPDERSGWSGLSGAAVVCQGYLVGVIVDDPVTYSNSITALRLERLADYPELIEILGQTIIPDDIGGVSTQAAHAQVVTSPHDLPESVDRQVRQVVVDLLHDQTGFVNLWGESGNGKTFLAQTIASELSAGRGPPVLIRVAANSPHPQSVYETDLHSALTVAGCEASQLTRTAMEAQMRELLASPSSSLGVVVLDDATEDDLVRLVPQVPVTPVVATSRTRIGSPDRSVRIDTYESHESLAYLRRRLPDASQDELSRIGNALGHRPLALALAAGAVAGEHLVLAELLDAVTKSVVATVSATEVLAGERGRTSLAALYRSVLTVLRADDVVLRIVDLLAWCTDTVGARDLYLYVLDTDDPTPVESLSLQAALRRLNDLALVTSRGRFIEMNQLTRQMVRDCTHDRGGGALALFTETIVALAPLAGDPDYVGYLGYMGREYLLFRRTLGAFLTQGDLGMLCLTSREWLLVSEGGPWLDSIGAMPEGQIFLEFGPSGLHIRDGGHRRDVTPAQARTIRAALRFYTLVAENAIDMALSEEQPLPFSFHETGPDGLTHRVADLVPADVLCNLAVPAWSICGRRWVPVQPSAASELCTRCMTLADDAEWWRRVEAQMGLLADLMAHVKVDHELRYRVEGITALAAEKLGNYNTHRNRLIRAKNACQAAPPTRQSVILAIRCHDHLMAETVPLDHDYLTAEAVPLDHESASWLLDAKSIVLGDPVLSSRWLGLGERSVIPDKFAATLPELLAHAEAAEIDPAATPSDRSLSEYGLFCISVRVYPWESASPHLLRSISLASVDPNDNQLRSALERLWVAHSGETLDGQPQCMACAAGNDTGQIFGNPRALICAACVRHAALAGPAHTDGRGPIEADATAFVAAADFDECRFCCRPSPEAGPAVGRFGASDPAVIICLSCVTLFNDAGNPSAPRA